MCWWRSPIESGKPFPASSRAGANTSAKLSVPQRESTVISAENAAGTPAARMPWSGTSLKPARAIGLRRGPHRRRRVAVHRNHARLARQAQQDRALAADGVHLRVDQAFDERRRDRGVDRIAAGLQHVDASIDREIGIGRDRAVRADQARIERSSSRSEEADRIVCSCPWKSAMVCRSPLADEREGEGEGENFACTLPGWRGSVRYQMIADSPGLAQRHQCVRAITRCALPSHAQRRDLVGLRAFSQSAARPCRTTPTRRLRPQG